MIAMEIIRHTPVWVWGVLAALVASGVSMMRARAVGAVRLAILPAVMIAYSLLSLMKPFHGVSLLVPAWAGGVALALLAGRLRVRPIGARYEPSTGIFHLPGSIVPLLVMLSLFAVKFVIGYVSAQDPQRLADPQFVSAVCVACGLLSGTLASRSLTVLSLKRSDRSEYAPVRPLGAAVSGERG